MALAGQLARTAGQAGQELLAPAEALASRSATLLPNRIMLLRTRVQIELGLVTAHLNLV